jgi:parallel beta-helix repeat protein
MRNGSRTRLVALIVVALTGATLAPPIASAAPDTFRDDDASVHEGDIEFIAARGVTNGCNPPANDLYCPDRAVTRGEMAAYLARSADVPERAKPAFDDESATIFAQEIRLIARAGITKGCNPPENSLYCPNANVTRGQMAAFLTRAFSLSASPVDYFGDDNGSVFEGDINALAHAGITVGCQPGAYCADSPVTRAQMASFIKRALTGGGDPPTPVGPPGTPPIGPPPEDPPSTLPTPGTSQPPGSVAVDPGESLAQAAASHPAGTTFYLTSGVHRGVYVRPKDGQAFVGAPGAILSGARVLSGFTQSGGLWRVAGQTQHNEEKGTCLDGYDGCVHPEQLFIDGQELWQVTSLSAVTSGTWYFDYGQDTIYIADNPAGHTIETSVTPVAFDGDATGVTIRDLVIEKYATPAQMGAVHGQTDRNGAYGNAWLVEGNEFRYNASSGIALGHDMVVKANFLHHNGRLGVGSGLADGATIVGNEISYNCRGTGFLCFGWGGGGIKLAGAKNTVIQSNFVHNNYAVGIHVDVQASNTLFEGNNVVDNYGSGIFVEVSSGATVRSNTVVDNGFERPDARGAGITISASTNVTVTGNKVIDNALGIVAYQHDRPPGLSQLVVTGNQVVQSDGYIGLRDQSNAAAFFDSASVTWDNNTYDLSDDRIFAYESDIVSVSEWVAQGLDRNSTFK